MGELPVPTCATCVYPIWTQSAQDKGGQVSFGYCRRNPPVPILKTVMVQGAIVGAPPDIQHQIEPHYSPVNSRLWCGEHLTPEEYSAFKGVADDNEGSDNGDGDEVA